MRIKEEFKRLGDFWLPSEPNRKAPGTLSISDGGNIELEVTGHFHDNLDEVFSTLFDNDSTDLKRIVGLVEEDGQVTLDDCYYKGPFNFIGSPSKFLIHVGRAFTGVAYNEGDIPLFNTLTFSVEGIDEWVGISGINVDYQREERGITATISYQPLADVLFNLNSGMQLLITFEWTLPGSSIIKEAKISQKTYFKLVSQEARKLSDFISVARKITTFLCFATDQTVSLDSMEATSNDHRENIVDGTAILIPINIYSPSRPYSKDEPTVYQHHMLFGFEQIQNEAEQKIKNWIEAYKKTYPAFDLYFSAKTEEHPYLDIKFLTLVRGLEAYHKRKFDENPDVSLKKRIKCIIEPFKEIIGNEVERSNLIGKIAKKRNDLTHSNLDSNPQITNDKDLWTLYLKAELLFQLLLLWSIGFSLEDINSIVADCDQLQWKLNQQL